MSAGLVSAGLGVGRAGRSGFGGTDVQDGWGLRHTRGNPGDNHKESRVEMEMEVRDEVTMASERLEAAARQLDEASARLAGVQLEASLERVSAREAELEERLAAAEATIAALQAQASGPGQTQGRKTAPPTGTLASKDAVHLEAGALDAALASLSVEQRIAVKAGLMRGGLLG